MTTSEAIHQPLTRLKDGGRAQGSPEERFQQQMSVVSHKRVKQLFLRQVQRILRRLDICITQHCQAEPGSCEARFRKEAQKSEWTLSGGRDRRAGCVFGRHSSNAAVSKHSSARHGPICTDGSDPTRRPWHAVLHPRRRFMQSEAGVDEVETKSVVLGGRREARDEGWPCARMVLSHQKFISSLRLHQTFHAAGCAPWKNVVRSLPSLFLLCWIVHLFPGYCKQERKATVDCNLHQKPVAEGFPPRVVSSPPSLNRSSESYISLSTSQPTQATAEADRLVEAP